MTPLCNVCARAASAFLVVRSGTHCACATLNLELAMRCFYFPSHEESDFIFHSCAFEPTACRGPGHHTPVPSAPVSSAASVAAREGGRRAAAKADGRRSPGRAGGQRSPSRQKSPPGTSSPILARRPERVRPIIPRCRTDSSASPKKSRKWTKNAWRTRTLISQEIRKAIKSIDATIRGCAPAVSSRIQAKGHCGQRFSLRRPTATVRTVAEGDRLDLDCQSLQQGIFEARD